VGTLPAPRRVHSAHPGGYSPQTLVAKFCNPSLFRSQPRREVSPPCVGYVPHPALGTDPTPPLGTFRTRLLGKLRNFCYLNSTSLVGFIPHSAGGYIPQPALGTVCIHSVDRFRKHRWVHSSSQNGYILHSPVAKVSNPLCVTLPTTQGYSPPHLCVESPTPRWVQSPSPGLYCPPGWYSPHGM
jgi:hypothetical protein